MDEKTIIQMLLNKMLEEGLWFTTKNDPTYEEASSYYELDQYGDLTDKAQSKIVKEIEDKLGDGAVEIDDVYLLTLPFEFDETEKVRVGR